MMPSAFGPFGLAGRLRRSAQMTAQEVPAPPDIWVKATSLRWINHVNHLGPDAEISLWRLSARYLIPKMRPGDLIAFAVGRVISGVGVYEYSLSLGQADAWNTYGPGLGVATYEELAQRISLSRDKAARFADRILSCRVITDFARLDPASSLSLADLPVAGDDGHLCSVATDLGQRILSQWQSHQKRTEVLDEVTAISIPRSDLQDRVWWTRPGQKRFQDRTISNYGGCCVVSGEVAAPALIAAHIYPFALSGDHDLTNALLLRADLHPLFDQGYWTIDRNGHVLFSSRLRKRYPKSAYPLLFEGKRLEALKAAPVCPSSEALNWHRSTKFLDRDDLRPR